MKVRISQIPEESSKVEIISKKKMKTTTSKKASEDEDDDEEDDIDFDEDDWFEGKEKKEKKPFEKIMFRFKDAGFVIPVYLVQSIDSEPVFVETPNPHWEYGIIINKDSLYSKTILYVNEELRDKRLEEMFEVLVENGLKVIDI